MAGQGLGTQPLIGARLGRPRQLLLLALNTILYVFLVRWVALNIDFGRLLQAVEHIPPTAILLSVVINFLALTLYGVRMQLLLFRNFAVSFATVNIGYAYGTVLPFRLGDAMKVYMCARLFAVRLSEMVAATVAEKIIDLCKLLLVGVVVAVLSAGDFIGAGTLLPLAAVIIVGLMGLLIMHLLLVRMIRLLPKKGALRRGVVGLFRHSSRYRPMPLLAATVAIWTTNIALFYVVFNTYLPGVSVGLIGAMAMLVITALAIAVPSAPAGVGLFEAGLVAYLHQVVHVADEQALAAATVFHIVVTVPQIFLALAWAAYIRLRPELARPPSFTVKTLLP